jgi:hypothetical protein
VPLTVPPHTHFRVTATVTESIMDVPVTTTWKSLKMGMRILLYFFSSTTYLLPYLITTNKLGDFCFLAIVN